MKSKTYGYAEWLMNTKSVSLKSQLLESHVVVLLATWLAAVEALINLLDNFYFVISAQDPTSNWLKDGDSIEI